MLYKGIISMLAFSGCERTSAQDPIKSFIGKSATHQVLQPFKVGEKNYGKLVAFSYDIDKDGIPETYTVHIAQQVYGRTAFKDYALALQIDYDQDGCIDYVVMDTDNDGVFDYEQRDFEECKSKHAKRT